MVSWGRTPTLKINVILIIKGWNSLKLIYKQMLFKFIICRGFLNKIHCIIKMKWLYDYYTEKESWYMCKTSNHWGKTPTPGYLAHSHSIGIVEWHTRYLSVEDPRIKVDGPPTHHVYGCHVTLVTRGTLRYVPYQKGVIQGHPYRKCHDENYVE